MKAYVIKDKETGEYKIYDEVRMLFSNYIFNADIFWDYEIALMDCPSFCEVVEITIVEGDLEKENEVLRKALELYSQEFKYDCNKCPREVWEKCDGFCNMKKVIDYFIQQAKEQVDGTHND